MKNRYPDGSHCPQKKSFLQGCMLVTDGQWLSATRHRWMECYVWGSGALYSWHLGTAVGAFGVWPPLVGLLMTPGFWWLCDAVCLTEWTIGLIHHTFCYGLILSDVFKILVLFTDKVEISLNASLLSFSLKYAIHLFSSFRNLNSVSNPFSFAERGI